MKDLKAEATYAEMIGTVLGYGRVFKVAATIYGRKYLLDEYQVRALQVMCKRTAEKSDADWQEFVDNVIVYNLPANPTYCETDGFDEDDREPFEFYDPNVDDEKPTDIHQMIFRKDGIFENEFGCGDNGGNCGFYNRTADMAFELF